VPPSLTQQAANAVTALRLALTPALLWSVARAGDGHSGVLAAVLFAIVALSDFVDGRIARRFGAESRGGRVLDHGADIIFILAALGLYVALGLVPWWVPAAIAAAFATYVIDSLRRSGARPSLIGSRIGHFGGVCNYALIGVLIGNETLGLAWLPPAVMQALFALVPLYSGAAILSRVMPRAAAAVVAGRDAGA
jgi:phosphatidylglycerophosphate synthase